MRRPFFFLIGIITILFVGCDSTQPGCNPKWVIVLCDLSTSVDTSSIDKIVLDSQKILEGLPENSFVSYYPIDFDPTLRALFAHTQQPVPYKPSLRRQYPRKLNELSDSLENNILKAYQRRIPQAGERDRPRSCILRSLYNASKLFDQQMVNSTDSVNYEYELVILSDMIEECENSPVGKLFFTKNGIARAKRKMENYDPIFSLANINISIVPTGSLDIYHEKYLNPDVIESIWDSVFVRADVPITNPNHFNYINNIPGRLTECMEQSLASE